MPNETIKPGKCRGQFVAEPVTENADGSFIVRGTPDRAENLDNIADAMVAWTAGLGRVVPPDLIHRFGGYAEQLRIIANELRDEERTAFY